jgi:hypothetical protein
MSTIKLTFAFGYKYCYEIRTADIAAIKFEFWTLRSRVLSSLEGIVRRFTIFQDIRTTESWIVDWDRRTSRATSIGE